MMYRCTYQEPGDCEHFPTAWKGERRCYFENRRSIGIRNMPHCCCPLSVYERRQYVERVE